MKIFGSLNESTGKLLILFFIGFFGITSCSRNKGLRETNQEYQTLFQLGETAYREQRYPDAIAFFEDCISRDKNDPLSNMYYGLALMGLGKLDAADQFMNKACNLEKNWPECWNNYSVLAYKMGQYKKSVSFADKALEVFSYQTPHLALANRAQALMELGKNNLARIDLEKAKELDDKDCTLRLILGKLHLRRPATENARTEIQVALALCMNDPRLHLWEAYLLFQEGKLEKTKAKYKYVINRFPRSSAVEIAINSLNNIKKNLAPEEPPI
jgi:tetratricopeptide (TPR) repeat protein